MLFRPVGGLALGFILTHPGPAQAQLTLGDVTRAIRIGSAIIDATEPRRRKSTGTSTSRRTTDRAATAASAAGAVLAGRTVSSRTARQAVNTGDDYVGVPYIWGGTSPRGFDCSGFVQYVYGENGVELPRTSRQMAHAGQSLPVDVRSLREGDLMLFRGRDGVINHVALYAGGNQILHSSSSGRGVRYDDLSSKRGAYFISHFVAARRVTQNGRSLVQSLGLIYRRYPFDHFDLPDGAPHVRIH